MIRRPILVSTKASLPLHPPGSIPSACCGTLPKIATSGSTVTRGDRWPGRPLDPSGAMRTIITDHCFGERFPGEIQMRARKWCCKRIGPGTGWGRAPKACKRLRFEFFSTRSRRSLRCHLLPPFPHLLPPHLLPLPLLPRPGLDHLVDGGRHRYTP